MPRLRLRNSAAEAMNLAARQMQRITGFDRVLICKFDDKWDGHVLAEARVPDLPSYLDLWFPASDISRQTRELHPCNRVRLLADASAGSGA